MAKLSQRWVSAGVDVQTFLSSLSQALGVNVDQALEGLWAWELISGWVYDPVSDTFSQSSMDLEASSSSLDEVIGSGHPRGRFSEGSTHPSAL